MKIKTYIIYLSFAIGLTSTFWGLNQLSLTAVSPFAWGSLLRYVVFLSIGAATIEVVARRTNLSRLLVAPLVATMIAVLAGAIWPLLVTIWFAFASYALGRAVFSWLTTADHQLSWLISFLTGAALYGTAVGLLAHFPINYPGMYALALAVPVVASRRAIIETIRDCRKRISQATDFVGLDLIIALIALVHFTVSLMPEVGHDALAMHLFVPGHLATRHEWSFGASTYVWAVMPMLGDWIFSIGYMLGGETAARLINVGFIFALGWLVRDLVLWAGGSAAGARWAVLLFLTTPLTFTESSSLFIESVWAAYLVAGSLMLFKLLEREPRNKSIHLAMAGLLLGGSLAAKAVTLTVLPVFMLFMAVHYRNWIRREFAGGIVQGLCLLLLLGAIPYATAWYLTGNPVFPFFNHIFQSPLWPAVAFDSSSIFGKGLTWDVLYQATFHTEKFLESKPGAAGFQWLILFVPSLLVLILCKHYRGMVLLVTATLAIALTFQSVTYLRYVFPAYVWVAAAIGTALSIQHANSMLAKAIASACLAVVILNLAFFKAGTYYGDLSLQPLLSEAGRENYLGKRLPIRNAVKLVNELNVGHTPVAVFASPLTAGLESDGLYSNWYNHQFQAKISAAVTAGEMARLLMSNAVDYVILDSGWGTPDKRAIIEGATVSLAEMGAVSIRKLGSDYLFKSELLKNVDFSGDEGWALTSGEIDRSAGQVTVSVSTPASQAVPIVEGRPYRNSVTARCANEPAQGRMQVNWLDSSSNFISTDIIVFDCTALDTTYSMDVVAPDKATLAVVYATGHTSKPIIFSVVSLKE